MSVPLNFSFTEEYLEAAFQFLRKYKWLYNTKNTDILTQRVLSNFSEEWITFFNTLSADDLHNLVTGQVKDGAPLSLKVLVDEINNLNPSVHLDPIENNDSHSRHGLSNKKVHEIGLLAPVINEIFKESGCDLIVDIGSGLGYLPHLLYEEYGALVLGLEASKKFLKLAQLNQDKKHPQSKQSVKFCELYVNRNSGCEIENLIEEHFQDQTRVCITGLHACADLSIEVLDLFLKIKCAQALVIMPCCYHRIVSEKEDSSRIYFKNFPASKTMTRLFEKYDGYSFIRQPFLRLACQQTSASFNSMSEEEHFNHSYQCMYRAVLQLVAETENCSVRRLKRKSGKSNVTDSDEGFQTYLNNLESTHKLESIGQLENHAQITDSAFLSKMNEKWNEYKSNCWLVEVLMGLQAAIQSICENVILLDRVEFLKEKGFQCYNRKITNDVISPRCWAIIAKKS